MRAASIGVATLLVATATFAQPAARRPTNIAALKAFPSFYHNRPILLVGTVTTTDPIAAHASGTTWSFTSSAKALQKPAAGRFLRGAINVRLDTTTGSVIGSANFDLRNVGP